MRNDGRFAPDSIGSHPLFLDTSALYARFYRGENNHREMNEFFRELSGGGFPYRPLMTNQYVLDELVALLLSVTTHSEAERALHSVMDSTAITVLSVSDDCFADAVDAFETYDDQHISLTDHTIGIHAAEHDVTHILTYDGDFEALGFTVLPR